MESKWINLLPSSPKLNQEQLKKLDELRLKYNILNNDFLLAVLGSPVFTLKIQEELHEKLKNQYPEKKEYQILRLMIRSRYFEKTEGEIDLIMNKISSFTSLCDYITKQDEIESPHHKSGIVNKLIDKILS